MRRGRGNRSSDGETVICDLILIVQKYHCSYSANLLKLYYHMSKLKKFWKMLGPGFITGASDNDPSGIATYSIAGAQTGFTTLWTLLYSLPLMISIEHMSARIGALSGCGLAGNIKKYYPQWILVIASTSIIFANVLNIGANIAGMAGGLNLLIPISVEYLSIILTAFILIMVIQLNYAQIVKIFKWAAVSLLSYVAAFLFINADWSVMLKNLIIPHIELNKEFLLVLFALLGTTISPYLSFWGASEEAEETHQDNPNIKICKFREIKRGRLHKIEFDTKFGMIFSNMVSFFVISLAASTLFKAGAFEIENLRQAAEALRPIAGDYAYLLFTAGLLGSGLLSIPVLAGGAAYVLAEIFGWKGSLDVQFHKAKQFYIILILSVFIGLSITFLGISPIKALFYSALINAMVSPLLILLIIHMANNPKIVGPYTMKPGTNYIGFFTFLLMTAGTVFVFIS